MYRLRATNRNFGCFENLTVVGDNKTYFELLKNFFNRTQNTIGKTEVG